MSITNREVAEAFADKREEAAANLYTAFTVNYKYLSIFSYGRHFEIARWVSNTECLFNPDHYSVTTSAHQVIVLQELIDVGTKTWKVPDCEIEHIHVYTMLKVDNLCRLLFRARGLLKEYEHDLLNALDYYEKFCERFDEVPDYSKLKIPDFPGRVIEKLDENTIINLTVRKVMGGGIK